MKQLNLFSSKKGNVAEAMIEIVIGLVITLSLFPIIKNTISGMANLTATETSILSIVPLLLIIGVIYFVYKKSMKK